MPAVVKAYIMANIEQFKYPSTKSALVASCAGLTDMPAGDREWFERNLPDGTYDSADEVIRALKL